MTKLRQRVISHAEGEQNCRSCVEPLPAHQTWPTSLWRWCSKPACLDHMRAGKGTSRVGRHVGSLQMKCGGPGCENFVPEGRYDNRSERLYCSPECWDARLMKGVQQLICKCGCNEEFLGRSSTKYHEQFKNKQHRSNYRRERFLASSVGPFRALVSEYLEGYAKQHYTDVRAVRNALGPFFIFLQEMKVMSIEDVTPQTITNYLTWADGKGRGSPRRSISLVGVFFQWTIYFGHRKGVNPVIARFHGFHQIEKNPRPLEPEESELSWKLLNERGTAMTRLLMALGEEAGLRIGELARIQLEDIDLAGRRVFVRLPTKNKKSRWSRFSAKTVRYLAEWMAERDPECGHDSLFYNHFKLPASAHVLRKAMKMILVKDVYGKHVNEAGFDDFSMHRLRHSMASNLLAGGADVNVIMAQGGWSTQAAMWFYAKPDEAAALVNYDAAMRRHREGKGKAPKSQTMDFAEYLKYTRTTSN